MEFIKRLGWYLVGFSIGLIFLAYILKNTSAGDGLDFCYLPNCRVLKNLRSKPAVFENTVEIPMDSITLLKALTDGDVDFGKSDTKAEPCKIYIVNYENKEIQLKNCEEKVFIQKIATVD